MAELPDSDDDFFPQAEQLLCFCAYVGRLEVCVKKYSLDLTTFSPFFQDGSDLLCKMVCYCPESVLEMLVCQLIHVLSALPMQDQRYIVDIEASLAHSSTPVAVSDTRFRKEVLFCHYRNSSSLRSVLVAADYKDSVIERLYNFLLNSAALALLDCAEFVDMLHMLGEDKLADFLFAWQVPDALSAKDLGDIYGIVLQHVASMASKDKALVFLANALYSKQNREQQCCEPSAIPQSWFISADNPEIDSKSQQLVVAATALIWLLRDPNEAVRYIMFKRANNPAFREILEVIHSRFASSGADTGFGIAVNVVLLCCRQSYRELFTLMTSLVFDTASVLATLNEVESACVAVGTLSSIISDEICFPNKQELSLTVVDKDSFLRLCFDYCVKLVRHVTLDLIYRPEDGYWNALLGALDGLVVAIAKAAGGCEFVEHYLMCALTLLDSFSPSMLFNLSEHVYAALMRCQPADPIGLDPTETLLAVMVRSIAEGASLRTRLQLVTILLRLQSTDSLGRLLHTDDLRYSYYQSTVQSLCLDACFYMDQDTWESLLLARGICTIGCANITPSLLADIIRQYGMTAVEVLELPVLVALSSFDMHDLQELELIHFTQLSKLKDGMLFNPHWRLVCAAMAEDLRLGTSTSLPSLCQMILISWQWVMVCCIRLIKKHCRHVFPHFRALLRILVAVSFEQFDKLAKKAGQTANKQLVAFASTMLRMRRDSYKDQTEGSVYTNADLLAIFQQHKLYDNILLKFLLLDVPGDAIAAVPDLLQAFISELARKHVLYVLENVDMVTNFWRNLLASAPPVSQSDTVKCIIKTIPAVAQGWKAKGTKGFKHSQLTELVNAWIDLLAPYKGEYSTEIRADLKSAPYLPQCYLYATISCKLFF